MYSKSEFHLRSQVYTVGKNEFENLKNKVEKFKHETGTKDAVVITMMTTYGVQKNEYFHQIVENNFTMEILFERI